MLAEILDYADRAAARLLEQYRTRVEMRGLVRGLADQAQEIETALWDLIEQTSIATATGVWLDKLGSIVGEAREGADDDHYRAYIRARIAANRSSGLIEDIIEVIKQWNLNVSPGLIIKERYPAGIEITVPGVTLLENVPRLVRLIRAARAAGVGVMLITRPQSTGQTFVFSATSSPGASTTRGFGDTTNPAVGGKWSSATRA